MPCISLERAHFTLGLSISSSRISCPLSVINSRTSFFPPQELSTGPQQPVDIPNDSPTRIPRDSPRFAPMGAHVMVIVRTVNVKVAVT